MKSFIALIVGALASVQLADAFDAGHMLCLVNKERSQAGMPNLGLDERLNQAAQEHCNFQASVGSMTHDGGDGESPGQRMTKFGFEWQSCAENISFGQTSEEECMEKWMESPGHRENILGDFTHFGAAVGYNGDTPYFTQDFASDGQHHDFPECPSNSESDGSESAYGESTDGGSGDGETVWYDENGNQVAAPGGSADATTSSTTIWTDEDGNQVAPPEESGDTVMIEDDGGDMIYD